MSRYSETSPLALAVLQTLKRGSSINPISLGDILRAHPDASSDIPNAMQALIDARLVSSMTHIVDGTATKLFWPTGLKPLTTKPPRKNAMPSKKPEAGSTTILKYILSHGPITGTDLAIKTSIAGRNIDAIIAKAIAGGSVLIRTGFVIEKGRELKHYMTPQQAIEWDAKQNKAEIPVNETREEIDDDNAMPPADPVLLAKANRMLREKVANLEADIIKQRNLLGSKTEQIVDMENRLAARSDILGQDNKTIHNLKNDIFARDMILHQVAEQLDCAIEDILSALVWTKTTKIGKPALLLIDSDDMTDLEMLAPDDDAQAMAMTNIELGHASRVLVVRVMGEANRNAVWKEVA
jgi:DNA-binding Xre family transcriptional regulator